MASELVISVSQLNDYVKTLLNMDPLLRKLSIRGEISGFKRHTSGHLYFSLKDQGALIRCVMFSTQAARLSVRPADGMQVVLTGGVSLYERDGQYQFYAESLRPDGVGALYAAYERLRERLKSEGLFDAARKRPLPAYPRRIAVITSPTGAAVRDIIRVAGMRNPGVDIVVLPVRVQGEGAAQGIAAALGRVHTIDGVQLVILARGGGSLEDLWAFNEECVARAIVDCALPVVSAVGHETDYTIADFAADLRAATPSQGAELCVPDLNLMRERAAALTSTAAKAMQGTLDALRDGLERLLGRRAFVTPSERIRQERQRLSDMTEAISGAALARITAERARMNTLNAALNALSPMRVLERGFAIVGDGQRVITSAQSVKPGDSLTVRMRDGAFDARVT